MRKVPQKGSVLPEMHIMLQQFARFRRRKVKSSAIFSFKCVHSTGHLVHGQYPYQTGLRSKVLVLCKVFSTYREVNTPRHGYKNRFSIAVK